MTWRGCVLCAQGPSAVQVAPQAAQQAVQPPPQQQQQHQSSQQSALQALQQQQQQVASTIEAGAAQLRKAAQDAFQAPRAPTLINRRQQQTAVSPGTHTLADKGASMGAGTAPTTDDRAIHSTAALVGGGSGSPYFDSLSEEALAWFASRRISRSTLLRSRVYQERKYSPAESAEVRGRCLSTNEHLCVRC